MDCGCQFPAPSKHDGDCRSCGGATKYSNGARVNRRAIKEDCNLIDSIADYLARSDSRLDQDYAVELRRLRDRMRNRG